MYRARKVSSKAIVYDAFTMLCICNVVFDLTIRSSGEVTADGCTLHTIQYCIHL